MATSNYPKVFSGAATTVCAAIVTAAFTIIACGSFAALIFTGPLSQYIPQGIWIGLFTAVVVGAIVSLTSSYPGVIAIPQDRVAPILALMTASITTRMEPASPQEKCLGVMAAIAVVSLVTGLFLFLLGRLRLGNMIRYIPYPVIGGFLAGSGWLLVRGAWRVMTGRALTLETLPLLFRSDVLAQWLPGVLFGCFLFLVLRRLRHPLTVPLLLFGAIGLYYVWRAAIGGPSTGGGAAGWQAELSSGVSSGTFSPLFMMNLAPWRIMAQEWSILATILLTSVVSILLTASALEVAAEEEIDLNRELRAAGLATVAAGIGGGMVGFHSLSMSRLVLSMGARSRWVGLGSAAVCGICLFFGPLAVSLVPQYVCGGLLFFLGLTFLWEWVYEAHRTLTRVDYGVVILILAVVGAVGYPEGVGVGIFAAAVMFIHNYSRVDVVTHAFSGTELRSNVDRPARDLRVLGEQGEQIYVLRLQGFIFFGTATHLLHEVRARSANVRLPALKFVVMDFRRVTGLDSSAIFSLGKVQRLARNEEFSLLMSQVSPPILSQLERGGLGANRDDTFQLLPDLDRALEWCEDRVLAAGGGKRNGEPVQMTEQLKDGWPAGVEPSRLMPYLERLEVPAATYLIRQSEPGEALYFIESGRVTARLEFEDGRTLRLRTMGSGTVVGEVGLFLGGVRGASVVTEQPCTVHRLSLEALERMSRENPDLALAFHRYLICLLGERLTNNSKLLRRIVE